MGSIFYLPVIEDRKLELTTQLLSQGYKLVASSLEAEENFMM